MTTDASPDRPRVLVLTRDAAGGRMAGPGIRAYELASALARHADVELLAARVEGSGPAGVRCAEFDRHDDRAVEQRLHDVDAVVAQPQWPLVMRALRRSGAQLVFDLYSPEPIEILEQTGRSRELFRGAIARMTLDRYLEALRIGHRFICASSIQRDLWLGAMLSRGLISPRMHDEDSSLTSRIAIVPFGVPSEPPVADTEPLRRFPAIDIKDEIVIWNGGIWNWLDAATAIRAMGELCRSRPRAKLVFMGSDARLAAAEANAEARSLARELGLLERVVFFNDEWVPYDQRGAWLLAASCAVSCHTTHLEARFAFRTRLLDCFWAGLPVVCTRGDFFADEVERRGLGAVVREGDPSALARALGSVLDKGKPAYATRLAEAANDYRWNKVAEPLRHFVADTRHPLPLGHGHPRPPAHFARDVGYHAVRRALNAVGIKGWPGRRGML